MCHNKSVLATIVMLVGLLISGCDRTTTTSSAASGVTQTSPRDEAWKTYWRPNWETTPDNSKKEKSVLSPTVSFADPGFRGSPVPQNEREKKQELRNRGDFVQSFQSEPECFGITLMVKNPRNADFGLQVFKGIDGRTNRWEWVLYRMDTFRAMASGEATGAGKGMGPDAMVKSVCSSIHEAVFFRGGKVEAE